VDNRQCMLEMINRGIGRTRRRSAQGCRLAIAALLRPLRFDATDRRGQQRRDGDRGLYGSFDSSRSSHSRFWTRRLRTRRVGRRTGRARAISSLAECNSAIQPAFAFSYGAVASKRSGDGQNSILRYGGRSPLAVATLPSALRFGATGWRSQPGEKITGDLPRKSRESRKSQDLQQLQSFRRAEDMGNYESYVNYRNLIKNVRRAGARAARRFSHIIRWWHQRRVIRCLLFGGFCCMVT
jgi:hypothetical protein